MAINQFQQNMKEYESFYNSIDGLFMGRESKTDVTIQPVDNFKDTFEAFFKKEIETKKNDGDGPFRIWVVGGGKIVSDILESGLKMTFQVTYVPYLLGKGIPLVHPSTEMLTKITSSRLYDGVVEVISEVQKADA